MPEIEINGEKKKVACGPCIRGHRSSKCTHKDRVLVEVRKPGRPLSACPHPVGSCSCERVVVNYAIPKTNNDCDCSSPQASGPNRVQKGKARKPGSSVTPSTVEKALNGTPASISQMVNGSTIEEAENTLEPKSCCGGPAPQADGSHSGSTGASAQNVGNGSTTPNAQPSQADPRAQLRLGMFGIGGYRATDEIGWNEAYPDVTHLPFEVNGVSRHLSTPENHTGAAVSRPSADRSTSRTSNIPPSSESTEQAQTHHTNNTPINGSHGDYRMVRGPHIFQRVIQSQMSGIENQAQSLHPIPQFSMESTAAFPQTGNANYITASGVSTFGGLNATSEPEPEPEPSCSCGDNCACFACQVHPKNKATTEYVKYYYELTSHEDPTGMSYINQNGSWNFDNPVFQSATNQPPQLRNLMHPQPTPTQELENFHIRPGSASNGTNGSHNTSHHGSPRVNGSTSPHAIPSTTFDAHNGILAQFDQDSPHNSEETTTLSPSSFFLQSYTYPGCNDQTGTCHCGDGCQCVGCLTHSGHQNPAPIENTFNSFAAPTTTPLHGPGCACPIPSMPMQPQSIAQSPAPASLHPTPHLAATTPAVSSPPSQVVRCNVFSQIHGPTCNCPGGSVVQAKAQVEAHTRMHGLDCRCPIGAEYVHAQAVAEARVHSQLHGPGCACPGIGSAGWSSNGMNGSGVG
ncbi:hypothetical protein NA57DRAFT_52185 [Rhizodiscina lignyota]|uniref:Copper-fist domain-containing protein n=1 Tax=Rhizodiscina lignyota TaxID=1504668 RepID=A0A9P4M9Y0_9PEZI|nr:hypothetical protein NA57DRAFT_52185 [Rhizodiscina lignyota]